MEVYLRFLGFMKGSQTNFHGIKFINYIYIHEHQLYTDYTYIPTLTTIIHNYKHHDIRTHIHTEGLLLVFI